MFPSFAIGKTLWLRGKTDQKINKKPTDPRLYSPSFTLQNLKKFSFLGTPHLKLAFNYEIKISLGREKADVLNM
jgi:hypothetical protein